MKNLVLFFDLETTGLPKQPGYNKYYSPKEISCYDSSRVVQIAIMLYEFNDLECKKITEENFIIKPSDFKIENDHIHGISNLSANQTGIEFKTAIDKIYDHFIKTNLLVAHNAQFDINVLSSELYRHDMFDLASYIEKLPYICTSHSTTNLLKLKFNKYKYKQPKLIELYKWLFGKFPPNMKNEQHNAVWDTQILSECFIELIKKKYIKI